MLELGFGLILGTACWSPPRSRSSPSPPQSHPAPPPLHSSSWRGQLAEQCRAGEDRPAGSLRLTRLFSAVWSRPDQPCNAGFLHAGKSFCPSLRNPEKARYEKSTVCPHLGVRQLGAILLRALIIGIVLHQPITKSDSSNFFCPAPQTVGRCEDEPLVDESPTANPAGVGLVTSFPVKDKLRQTILGVA